MKKRFLSILTALCLTLTLLPTAALAAEVSPEQTETSVARVGDLYYDSLEDAFNAIDTVGTVELVGDALLNNKIRIQSSQNVTLDLGTYTVKPSENFEFGRQQLFLNQGMLTIQGEGRIEATGELYPKIAIEQEQNESARLVILSGNIIADNFGVNIKKGSATISGGEISSISTGSGAGDPNCAVQVAEDTNVEISGDARLDGTVAAVSVLGGTLVIKDNAYLAGTSGGIMLSNSPAENTESAEKASLTMEGGTVESEKGFALSGNNTRSAGCSANITGGTLRQTSGETCIYWPMEGELTIGGDATVEGGSGIEAKMGTISIQDNATIRGTGAYLNDEPMSGGSQADGSAILISTQMYGNNEGQCMESPNLTVQITGGTLESANGNAVTVYNTEKTNKQKAAVTVTGGELKAADGKAAVQVTNVESENEKTAQLVTEDSANAFETSKSQTTVTVTAGAVLATVDQNNGTAYYTDVDDAMANTSGENERTVYVLGDSDVTAEKGVTLVTPADVELTVRPAEGTIVKETTSEGKTTYEVVDEGETGQTVPTVTLAADRTSAYVGDSITLTATVAGAEEGETITYTWYRDGQKVSGSSRTLTVTSSGTYTVVVKVEKSDGSAVSVEASPVSCTFTTHPTSSGSSSDPSYSPILDVSDGGSIKVNPRTPEEDDEVTITVDPDSGYEVDEVTVTDRNGREVKVTAERNGTYTFTQPRGRVTISVTFVREGGSTFFSDVPESFWAYDEIAWAYDNGYVNGTSASAFSPNASISRQQVWMILARLSGADPANMSAAREWAVTNGVSDGTTPGGAVTRQQLVALLYRYATLMGYANDQRADLSAYPDAGTVAGYAVEPMQWSVANSIVGGTSNGTLDPTGTATRAQFAVILYRFWDQVG